MSIALKAANSGLEDTLEIIPCTEFHTYGDVDAQCLCAEECFSCVSDIHRDLAVRLAFKTHLWRKVSKTLYRNHHKHTCLSRGMYATPGGTNYLSKHISDVASFLAVQKRRFLVSHILNM